MEARWLGWAGVELEHEGETVVIDPLIDPAGVWAAFGEVARDVELPEVVPAREGALAGLVTHLHRDHADASALTAALADGAAVHHPESVEENLALAQAEYELTVAELPRRTVATWESFEVGPFTCTALPAVDGLGDPQVSWLVEAGGTKVLHLGDTMFHGYWWQMARRAGPFDIVFVPINGAIVHFPHQQPPSPLPAVMGPEEAAVAASLLSPEAVVPIHFGGFALEPHYRPSSRALDEFAEETTRRAYRLMNLELDGAVDSSEISRK
jgi:L-ascorbate metabolism protein UlaG (beta-lactamase superfamily)